jgi:hypothetical protein
LVLLQKGFCVSLMSSWSMDGHCSYSMKFFDILISVTSSNLCYNSSNFKWKSTNPSTILERYPTMSSTSSSLYSIDTNLFFQSLH